jgi:hypothetical protein
MKIEVTKEDVFLGLRADCRNCPIARAAKRACGHSVVVTKCDLTIWVSSTLRYTFPLLPELQNWIGYFDYHGEGDPISFDLPINEQIFDRSV